MGLFTKPEPSVTRDTHTVHYRVLFQLADGSVLERHHNNFYFVEEDDIPDGHEYRRFVGKWRADAHMRRNVAQQATDGLWDGDDYIAPASILGATVEEVAVSEPGEFYEFPTKQGRRMEGATE